MLNSARTVVLTTRRQLTVDAVLWNRRESQMNYFKQMPALGNTNANPYRHQTALKAKNTTSDAVNRCIRVAILGIPNSGKSTLINQLVGRQLCPVSCKHNTTRQNARAVLHSEDAQVIFLDTPGVVDSKTANKYNLEESLMVDPDKSCRKADLLLVLHDVSNRYIREAIDPLVLRLLCKYYHRVPSILVLNKLDTIPRSRRVYDLIRKLTCNRLSLEEGLIKISEVDSKHSVDLYFKRKARLNEKDEESEEKSPSSINEVVEMAKSSELSDKQIRRIVRGLLGWPAFRDVFTISAKNGDGVDDLRNYLMDKAKPGRKGLPSDILTDVDPREGVVRIVKSKLLEYLPHSIPYRLQPVIEVWQAEEDYLSLVVSVQAKNKKELSAIIGSGGNTIRQISSSAEEVLRDFFQAEVKFLLQVIPPDQKLNNSPKRPEFKLNVNPPVFL